MILSARIYGVPKPQGSKRGFAWAAKDGRRGVALVESAGEGLKTWRSQVATEIRAARPDMPLEVPASLTVTFFLPAPKNRKRMPAAPGKRPDISKLVRALEDELTGVWIKDDSLICRVVAEKRWAIQEASGAAVELSELTKP